MESGVLGTIAAWCDALPKLSDPDAALRALADCLDAQTVALTRTPVSGSGSRIRAHDVERDPAALISGARSVMGAWFGKARPGVSWVRSSVDSPCDTQLQSFLDRRGLAELVVIPLHSAPGAQDALEIGFRSAVRPYRLALLKLLAQALARSWTPDAAHRFLDGLSVHEALTEVAREVPILGMDNPAGLSRAEYRICLLLSTGRPVKSVQADLGISDSTLRTHLRNIYAKTGTSDLRELVGTLSRLDGRAGARA